jgi:hypothetical protein
MALSIQLNSFRVDLMSTLLLPFAMINVMKYDGKALSLFRNILLVSIVIAVLYSLFLTTIPGFNPYIMLINPFQDVGGMDITYFSEYYRAEGQGRMFGRISGVFPHPMTNGLFLSVALMFIMSQIFDYGITKMRMFLLIILFVGTFIAIFLIGVRSSIGAIFCGLVLFLMLEMKVKPVFYVVFGGGVLFLFSMQIPGFKEYISSVFDMNSTNVSGSSLKMRISQLVGALDEIESNPFFGNGYGWTGYYNSVHGVHPILYSFESLFFIVLCNNGFLGLVFWFVMVLLYYREVTKNFKPNYSHVLLALIVTYLAYSAITGEYGYMRYFLIFYSIMYISGETKYRKQIGRKHEQKSTSNCILSSSVSSDSRE